jgi:hypothetical protein
VIRHRIRAWRRFLAAVLDPTLAGLPEVVRRLETEIDLHQRHAEYQAEQIAEERAEARQRAVGCVPARNRGRVRGL